MVQSLDKQEGYFRLGVCSYQKIAELIVQIWKDLEGAVLILCLCCVVLLGTNLVNQ